MKKDRTENRDKNGNLILCGANAYEEKYFYNHDFDRIPESIQGDLHIVCVLFTEEVGGIFTIGFDSEGQVVLSTDAEEDDIYYDEVSSGLLIGEIRRNREELFEQLELYYRLAVKGENPEALLKELTDVEEA